MFRSCGNAERNTESFWHAPKFGGGMSGRKRIGHGWIRKIGVAAPEEGGEGGCEVHSTLDD